MSSGTPARGDALALAQKAYALVEVRPRAAVALAERARSRAHAETDAEAEVAALHALAWAQRVLGDPHSVATARTGIRIGERHGLSRRVALLRRLLAVALAGAGSLAAARREIDTAISGLRGRDRAQSEVFRMAIHRHAQSVALEEHRRVMSAAARAVRTLEREGDEIWLARLLYNRGLLLFDRGEVERSSSDLQRALVLYQQVGAMSAAVDAAAALAEATLLRGDVVTCLETIDALADSLPEGDFSYALDGSRAAALARARLLPEAQAAIAAHVESFVKAGRRDFVATVLADLAAIAILSNDSATALRAAREAGRSFAARGKLVNSARARSLVLEAELLGGTARRSSIRSGLEAAAVLERAGWRLEALRTRLVVARVALAIGASRTAKEQLDRAVGLRRRGGIADRIELLRTRALLRRSEGEDDSAERLLAAGLRLVEDYRSALGGTELRASASALGTELSRVGLQIAFASDDPEKVLLWTERLRGNGLRLPPVRPLADRQLRARQSELRQVAARLRAAETDGRPVRGLAARQVKLEAAIRARARHVRGEGSPTVAPPRVRDAARALGERALVEYIELDGVLRALTLVGGRLLLHELGGAGVGAELEWLRFALARLAGRAASVTQRATALASADEAARALERQLIEPLLPAIADVPLVLVPSGALHALPWAVLPSLRGRPLIVAPSLSTWLDLQARPRSRGRRRVLIAGPRLHDAGPEVRALAREHPGATVLTGRAATAEATLHTLDGAALAHVACHGRFRSDSPLFSSLELADGPLNALELQRLRRPPDVLVLSACDLALSDRHPGDELLGLSAALLAMGTRTIVASVVPVPDAAARRLMLAFHRELAAGASPAHGLARAQASLRKGSEALAGFVCLGTG